MKGDFSRSTFKREKHYSGVRMQQGRVQLDADWNEQVDINLHRNESEMRDVIGPCGAPLKNPGFEIIPLEAGAGDFKITKGHYYVNGILCENEGDLLYTNQPDQPDLPDAAIHEYGVYLAYLDVWQRHIAALDDTDIREAALGWPDGPDTAARTKTVWQVKLLRVGGVDAKFNCLSKFQDWDKLIAGSSGKLSARAEPEGISVDPCIVAPGGGYRRLENQLYRVEIHNEGEVYVWPRPSGIAKTGATITEKDKLKVTKWKIGGSPFQDYQIVEVFSDQTDKMGKPGKLVRITKADETNETLTLYPDISEMAGHENLQVRRIATFKWSRDNGSIVAKWIAQQDNSLTVSSTGRDKELGFATEQWVELIDDTHELWGLPGTLVQLDRVEDQVLEINPTTATGSVQRSDFEKNPKVRRWDSLGAMIVEVPSTNDGWIMLEDGVEVKFEADVKSEAALYKTGDYWLIPARTATGDVEWPLDELNNPKPQSRHGIEHYYCRLALLRYYFNPDASKPSNILEHQSDCRLFFPAVTELTSFFYIGGDGQEAMPVPGKTVLLLQPLEVGVANGCRPVVGAKVSFRVLEGKGNGLLNGTPQQATVYTNPKGIASCQWELDHTTQSQQVEATLLDADGKQICAPIHFNANLSMASQVYYNPKACKSLKGIGTVQDAIDELCKKGIHEEPGIKICEVYISESKERLHNNMEIPVNKLKLYLEFNKDISLFPFDKVPPLYGKDSPICFVTGYVPFPFNSDKPIGFQPIILSASVKINKNTIEWNPDEATIKWLNNELLNKVNRVLVYLTLRGNFIWKDETSEPKLYMDGEVFGIPHERYGIDISLPSGDGRRGGNFEMWFWLVREAPHLVSLKIDPNQVTGGESSKGTVALSWAPVSDTVVDLRSSDPKVVTIPSNVTVKARVKIETFEISTQEIRDRTEITIEASLKEVMMENNLTVFPIAPEIKETSEMKKDDWLTKNPKFNAGGPFRWY